MWCWHSCYRAADGHIALRSFVRAGAAPTGYGGNRQSIGLCFRPASEASRDRMHILEVIAATPEAGLIRRSKTNNAQRLLFWMLNASQRDDDCVGS